MDESTNSTVAGANTLKIVSTVVYSLVGTAGVVGNTLVLVVMIAVKDLRNITNLFIISQSVLDLLASLFLFANYIAPDAIVPEQEWAGKFVCSVWNSSYILWGLIISSTYNLMLLSLERYLAVIHPVIYRTKFSYRRASAVAICPWIVGFGYEGHWAAANRYSKGHCIIQYKSYILQLLTGCASLIMEFLLPTVVMIFVYIKIGMSLRLRIGDVNSSTTTETVPTDENENTANSTQNQEAAPNYREKARKNIIKTLLIVCITYVICWLPQQVAYFYYNLGGNIDVDGELFAFTVYFAFLNMCVNPFIYTFKYRKFQKGLKSLFKKL